MNAPRNAPTVSPLQIVLSGTSLTFEPRAVVQGRASWNLPAPPQMLQIRLLWFTRGIGTVDSNVVEEMPIASSLALGDTTFRFQLPDAPHSFDGSLVSLVWAVELIAQPGNHLTGVEFVMAPIGKAMRLAPIETPDAANLKNRPSCLGALFGGGRKPPPPPNSPFDSNRSGFGS